jgi:undecaprenyl-diphosphatase
MPQTGVDRREIARTAARVAAALAVLYAVMVGLGLLLTKLLEGSWPVTAEGEVNRDLAGERTGVMNDVTVVLGEMGHTITIITLMVVAAVVLRLTLHRWRESAFVVLAVSAQALVFMLTQLVLSRQRPSVPRLDASPPTSSFPSGHTGAAIALYGAIALVVLWHVRRPALRIALAALLILVPFLVAYARLYRGMHHPTDIVGSVVNALTCLWVSARTFMPGGRDTAAEHRTGASASSAASERLAST